MTLKPCLSVCIGLLQIKKSPSVEGHPRQFTFAKRGWR
nr:MAG TPA: hypothetical protein [Caudoviricetes sp.]